MLLGTGFVEERYIPKRRMSDRFRVARKVVNALVFHLRCRAEGVLVFWNPPFPRLPSLCAYAFSFVRSAEHSLYLPLSTFRKWAVRCRI